LDDLLKGWIEGLMGDNNFDVSSMVSQITMTPTNALGADFWSTLLKIGASVVMPVALVILSYAMTAELYNVYCKTNGELDLQLVSATAFKFIFPWLCITKTYDLLQLIFTYFNKLIIQIGAALGTASIGKLTDAAALENQLAAMDFFGKFGLMMEMWPLWIIRKLMTLVITVVVYGRIIEIVLYWVFAPIPFATIINSDFGDVGKNFIKMFIALLLQGGFMMLCVAIYSVLVKQHVFESSVNGLWVLMGFSAVLVVALVKSGSMAKRLLGTF
jgi:hypothetical protein